MSDQRFFFLFFFSFFLFGFILQRHSASGEHLTLGLFSDSSALNHKGVNLDTILGSLGIAQVVLLR